MSTANDRALTLDRGLKLLFALAWSDEPVAVSHLAVELGVHRQAVYRLLGTLEQHGLAVKVSAGSYRLGLAAIGLIGAAMRRLDGAMRPVLRDLANACAATSYLMLEDGDDAVAALVVEPSHTTFHLSLRQGTRFPLTQAGAAGVAVLAGRNETATDAAEIREARLSGVAVSRGRVTPGGLGVAAPLRLHPDTGPLASIGVITMLEGADTERITTHVIAAAAEASAQ